MKKWQNIDYLRLGTPFQQLVHQKLCEIDILTILCKYDPIVTGTIPIGINIDGSDIDIICNVLDFDEFELHVRNRFSSEKGFFDKRNGHSYMAAFEYSGFIFEVYGESKPTTEQNAYRHMLIEDRILNIAGNHFREKIIRLKSSGYKTEPAFGLLLNLHNPYDDLLGMDSMTDKELEIFIANNNHLLSRE